MFHVVPHATHAYLGPRESAYTLRRPDSYQQFQRGVPPTYWILREVRSLCAPNAAQAYIAADTFLEAP